VVEAREGGKGAIDWPELMVRGLSAGYGDGDVVHDFDLTVSSGEVVRIVGRNGAGKSTLLSCIAGAHRPRAGSILVGGVSLLEWPVAAKRIIGFSAGTCPFPYLTAAEHFTILRRAYGLKRSSTEAFLEHFADWQCVRALNRQVRAFSHGMRQQLSLLLAVVHDPRLLLLDEATDGLDSETQAAWSEFLEQRTNAGRALVFVAHKDAVAAGFPPFRPVPIVRDDAGVGDAEA
jgi:ABC-2 type transport system ATP-binding protein